MRMTIVDRKTGEYPNLSQIVRKEKWAKGLTWYYLDGFALDEDGALWLIDGCNGLEGCPEERFEVIFHPEPGDRMEPEDHEGKQDCQSIPEPGKEG